MVGSKKVVLFLTLSILVSTVILNHRTLALENALNEQERILTFDSHIIINQDTSLTVTENIRVYANGNEIKRGIYRDFPTKYKNAKGLNYNTTFEVLEVLKDGIKEDYHTEKLSNGTRLYIGNSSVYLTPGFYLYSIVYKTNGQLGFFKDHDELYYNITGNGWSFLIEEATATIQLPNGVSADQVKLEAYTGATGAKGTNYTSEVYSADGNNYAFFKTTAQLYSKQGLTIVVGWPKGFVNEPTQSQKLLTSLLNNLKSLIGAGLLAFMFLYYLFVWFKHGRDPKGIGTIVPQFNITCGISPAGARYIHKMGFDNKTLTASLVSMAIKGYIKINESKKEFSIELLGDNQEKLTGEEKVLAERFFNGDSKSFTFKQTHAHKISTAIKLFKKNLEETYLDKYFKNNRAFLIVPLVLNLLFLVVVSFANPENIFLIVWLAGWSVGIVVLTNILIKPAIDSLLSGSTKNVIGLLFALPFVLAEIFVLCTLTSSSGYISSGILFAMFILNAVGGGAMKVRTVLGKKVEDQVLGLKEYLTAVEKPRYASNINLETPDSLKVYEKYLAYAIALDVEPIWTGRFKAQIDAAQITNADGTYNTYWFHGSSLYAGAALAGSLGGAFTGAISSSSTSPGSSSGFSGGGGGGGSSGGGGGGGGGGGW
ncbi:MAG: DUF2207 domain-containing protein [Patescibacteria group bacterium]